MNLAEAKVLSSSLLELQELIHEKAAALLKEMPVAERLLLEDELRSLWQLQKERARRLNK